MTWSFVAPDLWRGKKVSLEDWIIHNMNYDRVCQLRFRRNQREIGDAEWEHIKATYRPLQFAKPLERPPTEENHHGRTS